MLQRHVRRSRLTQLPSISHCPRGPISRGALKWYEQCEHRRKIANICVALNNSRFVYTVSIMMYGRRICTLHTSYGTDRSPRKPTLSLRRSLQHFAMTRMICTCRQHGGNNRSVHGDDYWNLKIQSLPLASIPIGKPFPHHRDQRLFNGPI